MLPVAIFLSQKRQELRPRASDPTAGLVSRWTLDDDKVTGSTVVDSTDSNDGKINGTVTSIAGKINQGRKFNGTNGYIKVNNASNIKDLTSITISAWVHAYSFPSYATILMKSNSGWTSGYGIFYNTGKLCMFVTNYASSKACAPFTASSNPSDIHLVTGTYDFNSDQNQRKVKIYIDGQEKNSAVYKTGIDQNGNDLFIGRGSGGNYYWNGIIDDLRIYNRALTTTEVQDLYLSATVPSATPSPTQPIGPTITPSPTQPIGPTITPSPTPTGGISPTNSPTIPGATFTPIPTATSVPSASPSPTPRSDEDKYMIDPGNKQSLAINIGPGTSPRIRFKAKLGSVKNYPEMYMKLRAKDELAFMSNPTPAPSSDTCNNPPAGEKDFYIPMKANGGVYSPVPQIAVSAPSGATVPVVTSDGWVSLSGILAGKFYTLTLKAPKTRAEKMIEHAQLQANQSNQVQDFDWTGKTLDPGDLPDPNNNKKQDCTVNSVDIALINSRLGKTDNDNLEVADVNYDGVVNANDISQVVGTLSTKPDDEI